MGKCLLILIVFLLLAGTVFGAEYPVGKGSTILSGTFSFTNWSGELYEMKGHYSTTTVALAPNVLTFVVPNFAVGGELQLTRSSYGNVSATSWDIGPKLCYFVGGPSSKVYPYFGLGIAYLNYNTESWFMSYDMSNRYLGWQRFQSTTSGAKLYFSVGSSIMIASHLAVVCEGSYNLVFLNPKYGESESGISSR